MENERIWTLIAKRLAGEATDEELLELHDLLKENPEAHYSLEVFDELWDQHQYAKRKPLAAYTRLIEKMEERGIEFPPGKRTALQKQSAEAKKATMPRFFSTGLMIRNNFKTSVRNLFRNKIYSLINITGLAIGMGASLLMLLWIYDELSYNKFNTNKDRIYVVMTHSTVNGKVETSGGTSMLLAPVLKENYAEVDEVARINHVASFMFHAGDKHIWSEGLITDPAFLKIFDYPLLQGNRNTAINHPHSLVVTERFARQLFGSTDVMGKTVRIDSNALFSVTGVLKDIPQNSTLQFDYLVPFSYNKEVHWDRPYWDAPIIGTMVMLKQGVSEKEANAKFVNIIKSHNSDLNYELSLHPMNKWRLYSRFENGHAVAGRMREVRQFAAIACLILLIACINYMNLSTARSVHRAKEIGIRKVVGAEKSSLVGWLLGESVLISCIAGIIALIIVQPNLGWFNHLTYKSLVIPYDSVYFWISACAFILITGLLAGSYPAFYLSAFKPIRVLKGTFKAAHALITPRKLLVVLQFTFAIALIICTIIIYRQIKYGESRDSGYDRDNLAFVYLKGDMNKKYELISSGLFKSDAVTSLTRTNSPITDIWTGDDTYTWEGKDPNRSVTFDKYHTDKDFVKTMGMTLVAGRDINIDKFPTDSGAAILNEAAVKVMGLKDPVGKMIKSAEGSFQVVGVIKDFIPEAPYQPTSPTVIQGPGKQHWYGTLSFRLNGKHATSENLKKIAAVLKETNPDYPFEYYFVDEQYASKFRDEQNTGELAAIFAGLTIFISCLGLFALAAYMAENRVKEIGVRKVLGASVTTITTLLSKDFLKLVLIAFAIASPLAWWAMNGWLQDYSYRVSISWWVFALAGLMSMIIALATVGYQSIKAALANPVKSLRTE